MKNLAISMERCNAERVKKVFTSILVQIFLISFLLLVSSTKQYASNSDPAFGDKWCRCDHPDSMKGGENGVHCVDGTPNTYCDANYYCEDVYNDYNVRNGTKDDQTDKGKTGPHCEYGNLGGESGAHCVSPGDDNTSAAPDPSSYNSNYYYRDKKNSCCGGNETTVNASGQCIFGNGATVPCANFKNGVCTSVSTAVGNMSTDPKAFVSSIFSVLLSISGAIAVLIIMISGYQIMTSQGDPEKIQSAKDTLTAAIIGLLFLIFSFVILQIIGVDILKLPGFSQ